MSYREAYAQAWREGGPEAAIELLRRIFHDPNNQQVRGRAADYLREERDCLDPKSGFELLTSSFAAKPAPELIEQLIEAFPGDEDEWHDELLEALRRQPLNALILAVSICGGTEATLHSAHYDPENEAWVAQYDLSQTVLHDEDDLSEAEERFIDTLCSDDDFTIAFEDETIEGQRLYHDLRIAQHAQAVAPLIEQLFLDPRFARLPKSLPFYCLVTEDDGFEPSDDLHFAQPVVQPWTRERLAQHPLSEIYLNAAKPLAEPSPARQWLTLVPKVGQLQGENLGKLLELIRNDPELQTMSRALAEARLARYLKRIREDPQTSGAAIDPALTTRWSDAEEPEFPGGVWPKARAWCNSGPSPRHWLTLFWALGDTEFCRAYAQSLLATFGLRATKGVDRRALEYTGWTIDQVWEIWGDVPHRERAGLRDDFNAAHERLAADPHPFIQMQLIERALGPFDEHDDDALLPPMPRAYVDHLASGLDDVDDELQFYDAGYSYLLRRVEMLGPQAAGLVPRLLDHLERRSTPRRYERAQIIERFAEILRKVGLEEPPDIVHGYVEADQYHGIEGYTEWTEARPKRQWQAFLEQFRNEPIKFEEAAVWEPWLPGSRVGLELFVAGIRGDEPENGAPSAIESALTVAAQYAGPRLTLLVQHLADALNHRRLSISEAHRNQRIIDLLGALPEKSEAYTEKLKCARLLAVRFACDEGDTPRAEALVDRWLTLYPEHAMLHFMAAQLTAERAGAEAAAQRIFDVLDILVGDDLVYRKAICSWTSEKGTAWSDIGVAEIHTLFRWAEAHLEADGYRGGSYVGGPSGIDHDPFYAALADMVGSWSVSTRQQQLQELSELWACDARLHQASEAELIEELETANWRICQCIVPRLLGVEPGPLVVEALCQLCERNLEHEDRRRWLLQRYWASEPLQPALLKMASFRAYLPWFILRCPGFPAVDLFRAVHIKLVAIGLAQAALDCARVLVSEEGEKIHPRAAKVVLSAFKALNQAIEATADLQQGVTILKMLSERLHAQDPDQLLICSNIGVYRYRAGDRAGAEQTFDQLLAEDWSRFEPRRAKSGRFIGDLDHEVITVFRQYWAMTQFNAACVYANVERPEAALEALERAHELRPEVYGREHFLADDDLKPLHEHPAFQTLVEREAE